MVVTDATVAASGGQTLAEIYDVSGSPQQFSAMSTRGRIQNATTLTAGFVLTGSLPRRLLIRGVGPSLAPLGVADAVGDPRVAVYDNNGALVAQNDDWQAPLNGGSTGAQLAAAAQSVGDFALLPGSKDAAVVVTLAPGTYTAQVSAPTGQSGSAVVEIYELP